MPRALQCICHKRSQADRQRPTTRAQVVRPTRPSLVHRQKDRIDPVRRCSRLGVEHRARWRVAVLERPLEEPRTPTAGTRPTGGLRAPRGALPDAPGPKGRRRAQQQPRRRLSFSALRHLSYAVRAAVRCEPRRARCVRRSGRRKEPARTARGRLFACAFVMTQNARPPVCAIRRRADKQAAVWCT